MKTILKFGFAVIIASVALAACGKYEEGPKISLASKKGRLANTWKFEARFKNDQDITSQVAPYYANFSMEFTKDGKYTYTFGSLTDTGTWEFINDKESIKTLSSATGATADTTNIVRLKSNEMWTTYTSGSDTYVDHYVTK